MDLMHIATLSTSAAWRRGDDDRMIGDYPNPPRVSAQVVYLSLFALKCLSLSFLHQNVFLSLSLANARWVL